MPVDASVHGLDVSWQFISCGRRKEAQIIDLPGGAFQGKLHSVIKYNNFA